jgi:manganese efflux pump family protein
VSRLGPRSCTQVPGSTVKLIALVLPLGLDTFGVAVALGIAGLPSRKRLQLSLLFAAFEAGMPLIGVVIGVPIGRAIGSVADYVAAGLVVALGAYLLVGEDDGTERDRLLSMTHRGLLGGLALGISISLDELAIGFSAGLLRLPILAMVLAIGAQAFLVTQVGVRLGTRVGARTREAAERLAGAALIALGVVLLVERLVS